MKIAIIGATGLVGRTMLKVLEERKVHYSQIFLAASDNSAGKIIEYDELKYEVMTVTQVLQMQPDVALFSAGATTSLEWAPKFADKGIFVIDNSSAWRMYDHVPLVVPEVNADVLHREHKIIANPNCSTIGLVVAINPLHLRFKLKRMVVSTYQSVSGSGQKGIEQLMAERRGEDKRLAYPHRIDLNVIPHGGNFEPNGYTSEEIKLMLETRKILRVPDLDITGTVVRVPVLYCHSESVNAEFENDFSMEEVTEALAAAEGVKIVDDPVYNIYPLAIDAAGQDDTHVGRLRKDLFHPRTLNMWVVSDNVRKGAATNAVQILEKLVEMKLIG